MYWQPLARRACLILALGAVVLAAPLAARAQDSAIEERLDRLERDLNMLQRQVYRGAPAPMGAPAGNAVNTEIRMDRVEAQMRDLTGRLEEVMNRLEQLRQRVEQINGDIDARLGQRPGGPGPLASVPPPRPAPPGRPTAALPFPPAPPGAADDELTPPRSFGGPPMPPAMAAGPAGEPGEPSPLFGTLTPPGTPSPGGELASAAPAGRAPAGGTLPDGSATAQYNYAFGLLKKADYPAAEAALKSFIEQHPKDAMAGNAQYWLGETYYTRGRYIEAASAFAEGYKRYPKSAKAPDGLLKLGMSLAHANQKQNACVALSQLDHDFPHAGAAVKDRAAAEKKRLGC